MSARLRYRRRLAVVVVGGRDAVIAVATVLVASLTILAAGARGDVEFGSVDDSPAVGSPVGFRPSSSSSSVKDYYNPAGGSRRAAATTVVAGASEDGVAADGWPPSDDAMLRRLGADYNPAWMSIDRPPELDRNSDVFQSQLMVEPINVKLYRQLTRHVNFTVRDHSTGLHHPMKPSVRKYLEKWLLERASCPVRLVWDDLGTLFWPRWIRRGVCGNDRRNKATTTAGLGVHMDGRVDADLNDPAVEQSCSWPPGMRCVPEASQTVHLLRWQCRQVQQQKPKQHHRRIRPSRRAADADDTSSTSSSGRVTSSAGGLHRLSEPVGVDHSSAAAAVHRGSSSSIGHHHHLHRRRQRYRHRMTVASPSTDGDYEDDDDEALTMRCRWKKVPYPVTTGCFCSC